MTINELEAEAVRLQRIGNIAAAEAKKKEAQGAARKAREEEKASYGGGSGIDAPCAQVYSNRKSTGIVLF